MKNKNIKIYILILLSFVLGGINSYYIINKKVSLPKGKEKVIIEDKGLATSVEKVFDSVVIVEGFYGMQKVSTGTGFVYKKDKQKGYIVTNNHVIEKSNKIEVVFTNNKRVEAKILGSDSLADIAVLSVDSKNIIQIAKLGKSEDMKLGETVFTIGAPMGSVYSGTVTRGILSGKDRMVSVSTTGYTNDWIVKAIQTDAAINPGNSGGPLVNVNGEVIGINSLKLVQDEIEGMGFAIPIEDARRYMEILESGKKIERPYLGIAMIDASDAYQLYTSGILIEGNIKDGVVIEAVNEDSPAFKGGIKKGDIVFELNKVKIENKAQLRYELYKYNIGEKIELKANRDGKVKAISITLTKQPN